MEELGGTELRGVYFLCATPSLRASPWNPFFIIPHPPIYTRQNYLTVVFPIPPPCQIR